LSGTKQPHQQHENKTRQLGGPHNDCDFGSNNSRSKLPSHYAEQADPDGHQNFD